MPYKIRGDVEVERDLLVNRNIGVNTSAPTEKLEVLGTAKVSELIVSGQGQSYKLPTSAGVSGQYLTSNGSNFTAYWDPNKPKLVFSAAGTGSNIYSNTSAYEYIFKGISGSDIVSVSSNSTTITISAPSYAPITLSAHGTGANLFLGVSGGTELRYRTIVGSNIEVSARTNDILISALTQNITLSSLGGGTSLAIGVSANREIQIRSLTAGGAVDITTSSNTINISARSIINTVTISGGRNITISNPTITGTGTVDIGLVTTPSFGEVSADNVYITSALTTNQIGIGKTPAAGIAIDISANGAIRINVGTTAQRPSTPGAGMIRYLNGRGYFEHYNDTFSQWNPIGYWVYLGQQGVSGSSTDHTSFAGDDLRTYETIYCEIVYWSPSSANGLRARVIVEGSAQPNAYVQTRFEISGTSTELAATTNDGSPSSHIVCSPQTTGSQIARALQGHLIIYNYSSTATFRPDGGIGYKGKFYSFATGTSANPIAGLVYGRVTPLNDDARVTGIQWSPSSDTQDGSIRYFGFRGFSNA